MLWRPGWLVRYVLGPYDDEWISSLYGDLVAGLTVAMTLIPQGLSYSTLAGLPAVNGCVYVLALTHIFVRACVHVCSNQHTHYVQVVRRYRTFHCLRYLRVLYAAGSWARGLGFASAWFTVSHAIILSSDMTHFVSTVLANTISTQSTILSLHWTSVHRLALYVGSFFSRLACSILEN
jgi:hypothetical protein